MQQKPDGHEIDGRLQQMMRQQAFKAVREGRPVRIAPPAFGESARIPTAVGIIERCSMSCPPDR